MTRPTPDPGTGLEILETPRLLLDHGKLDANLARMRDRARELDVRLRPHIKTAKSPPVAERAHAGRTGPITVSTLQEAEAFHEEGFNDLTYAVPPTPAKAQRAAKLHAQGADLKLVAEQPATVRAIAQAGADNDATLPVLLEIDCDGTRGGIPPEHDRLAETADLLEQASGARLEGVLTHAGSAYDARGDEELLRAAERERAAAVDAAERLRAGGHEVETVSVGSTPTALSAENLDGVTEMRPGNYVFFDLFQAGLGVCSVDDVAVTVLAEVIGHRDRDGCPIVDAGSLSLSEDRSTRAFGDERDKAYGLVLDIDRGSLGEEVLVTETSQEHGILDRAQGEPPDLGVGDRVRVVPNHSCIMAACHPGYVVVEDGRVRDVWPRVNHW